MHDVKIRSSSLACMYKPVDDLFKLLDLCVKDLGRYSARPKDESLFKFSSALS